MDVDLFIYLLILWMESISSEATLFLLIFYFLIHKIFNQNHLFNTKIIEVELNVNNFQCKKMKKDILQHQIAATYLHFWTEKNSFSGWILYLKYCLSQKYTDFEDS